MAEAAALKKLKAQLNCPICLVTYTEPKQLQCHHIYCQQCLGRLVIRNQQGQLILTCPNCRQVTPVPTNGVAGLPAAFHINHLLDILKEHKKAKEGALYCADHQERELELYCESCEQLICVHCVTTEHKGHQCSLLKDVLEKCKEEIKASLTPAKEQLSAVGKASKQVKSQKKEIVDKQAILEAKMRRDSQQLIDIITARTNEHVSKLRRISTAKLRALDSQGEQLDTSGAQLSSYVEMVLETITTGTPAKILSMKTAIAKQVKELTTSLQTDTLEPVTQVDMEYSSGNEVREVCRNYGEVDASRSPDPSMCRATGKGLEVATVGERSSAVLQVVNFKGQPLKEPIRSSECELVSDITGSRTRGSVERRGQSQYEINYQPTIKGRHQLHVKVEGQHIRGSPFTITVTSSVEKLGTPIRTIDEMKYPWGVAINQRGEMMVTETDRHHVSIFSYSGEKLRSFGTRGSGQVQFLNLAGVVLDSDENILVVDSGNHRIQKFSADGQFLTAVGTTGSGCLQFSAPRGIAVNKSSNKVYVADTYNHRVQVLNSDLTFSSTFGEQGSGEGQFNRPYCAAFDSSGNVYITDSYNHRVQVFTAEGKFLRMFGKRGGRKGELKEPRGVAIDTRDMVYISDMNNRVSVFTSGGQFVTSFGRKGAGKGELDCPVGVAVDSNGVVYVCDQKNNRVQLF